MSNYLAIATVTAALSQLIQAAIELDVFGSSVTTVRPDVAGNDTTQAKVNVYLYQITPNASFRNDDLPTRRADGSLVQRPKAAIDLHYLLTFYGEELDMVPQRLLGSVVRTLHSEPLLTRQRIRDTINSSTFSFLAASDLADEVELVKFTPLPLSLEELSKLWSILLQTPYALSVTYQGTVVLIESEQTPRQTLPVQERKVYVLPFSQQVIEKITSTPNVPAIGRPADELIVADSVISILGKHLQGDPTSMQILVRISGQDVAPPLGNIGTDRIDVSLQGIPQPLHSGVQGVQVIQKLKLGDPAAPHNGFESNVFPFVLHPTMSGPQKQNMQADANGLVSGDLTVTINPIVGVKQRVTVLLVNTQPPAEGPASYSFTASSLTADTNTITVSISGVKTGSYLVRVLVDGAISVLDNDKKNAPLALP